MVELLSYARDTIGYRRERIAPTGSPEVRSDLGLLIGPHDPPILNGPTGETHAVGIICTPVGCEATLGIPPGRIRGRVVTLADHWASARALRERMRGGDDPKWPPGGAARPGRGRRTWSRAGFGWRTSARAE